MKKLIAFSATILGVILFTSTIVNTTSAQTAPTVTPIPDGVLKIANKSCKACHMEGGSKMAMSMVNMSKWDTYTIEKQAAKAKAMCKMISKGKMPPKNYVKNNPDVALTQEDIKTICDWSATLQVSKK